MARSSLSQLRAVDFQQKPFNTQQFLDSINRAIELAKEKFVHRAERAGNEKRLPRLSPREREVFDLLLQGSASKGIAKTLRISYKTVDVHRASLLRKLDVASYRELIKKSRSFGPKIRLAAHVLTFADPDQPVPDRS